jgi:hypothetical protein
MQDEARIGEIIRAIRAPEEVYRRRVEEKGWRERQPRLRFS